jgi:signal transduction histidine kinase
LTKGAQAEMRILLLELRPDALVETSLDALLRQLGQAISSRAMVEVGLDITAVCEPPAEVKVALYRIAQEALNNVVKHADAAHVALSLSCNAEAITLAVQDDGCGFDPDMTPRERLGQRSMQERACAIGAQLIVTSTPGEGTTITCNWRSGPAAA